MNKKLKTKIINQSIIKEEELKIFINYIINKVNDISKYMKNIESYTKNNLANEIFWSHNLDSKIHNIKDNYYCIFRINNKDYLLDINFYNNKIPKLKENKYIELTKDVYKEYIEIIGG